MIKMILKIVISLVVLLPLSILLHEGFHALAAYVFYGATSQLALFPEYGVIAQIRHFSNSIGSLVYYAGGMCLFPVLIGLFWILKKRIWETSFILLVLACANLGYGLYEGFNYIKLDSLVINISLSMLSLGLFAGTIWFVIKSMRIETVS